MAAMQGYVAPGFEAVAREFERNFTERGEIGAAFAVVKNGTPVMDVWGGSAASERAWTGDTLQVVFSGTKGLVAACVLKLVEDGRLDLEAPVARYWPEFAQGGKEHVRVRHVVSHTAGLPGIHELLEPADIVDYERIEDLLAAQPLARDPNVEIVRNYGGGILYLSHDSHIFFQERHNVDLTATSLRASQWDGLLPEAIRNRIFGIPASPP